MQVVSCEFCEIFKNTDFHRTPPLAASIAPLTHKKLGQLLLLPLYFEMETKVSKSS